VSAAARRAGLRAWARAVAATLALTAAAPLRAAEDFQDVRVNEGDTLWSISQTYLKDPQRWPDLLKHNPQLSSDPTVALAGTRLRIPVLMIKENLRSAELVHLLGDVRFRRRDTEDWKTARLSMALYNEDGLRTLEAAGAHVKFPTGETIRVSENSLITVRPEKKRETVELLSGDVRARQARVITAGGVQVDPVGTQADFRTRIKPDRAELVLVYRGQVDVTARGKTVRVPEGFGAEVRPASQPGEPVPFPEIPLVAAGGRLPPSQDTFIKEIATPEGLVVSVELPARDAKSSDAAGSQRARSVTSRTLFEKYHVEVDDQPDFKSPRVSRTFPLSEKLNLRRLDLPDGKYWWRIAFVDAIGMEGSFSEGRSFTMDRTPPACVIARPAEQEEFPWRQEFVDVAGQLEPEATVTVDGKPADVDPSGRFSTLLALREGKNRLVFEARDSSGNTTRLERVVYRLSQGQQTKFQKPARTSAQEGKPPEKNTGLANVALGLVTIGTILGIFLLVL
jgi:hypothetical protein